MTEGGVVLSDLVTPGLGVVPQQRSAHSVQQHLRALACRPAATFRIVVRVRAATVHGGGSDSRTAPFIAGFLAGWLFFHILRATPYLPPRGCDATRTRRGYS